MEKICIESNVPIPERRFRESESENLRVALRGMKPGDSFVYMKCNQRLYGVAKQVGVKIKTRKLDKGGWRVWKVAELNGSAQ